MTFAPLAGGQWARLSVRYARGTVPVGMNRRTIWTRYYTPREFYRVTDDYFKTETGSVSVPLSNPSTV